MPKMYVKDENINGLNTTIGTIMGIGDKFFTLRKPEYNSSFPTIFIFYVEFYA